EKGGPADTLGRPLVTFGLEVATDVVSVEIARHYHRIGARSRVGHDRGCLIQVLGRRQVGLSLEMNGVDPEPSVTHPHRGGRRGPALTSAGAGVRQEDFPGA